MMQSIHYLGWALVLFGHAALWVLLFNRAHASAVPRRTIKIIEKIYVAIIVLGACLWIAWGGAAVLAGEPHLRQILSGRPGLAAYATLCMATGVYVAACWTWRRAVLGSPAYLLSNDTVGLDVTREIGQRPVGSTLARVLDWIPGNQMFRLHIHEKQLVHPRLPAALDGLTIAHLSDFHFTGRIEKPYFEYVVRRTNELDADLLAITGDIIDKAQCLDWIPSILGGLRSRLGIYFILGNHDKRLADPERVRQLLRELGMTDLGSRHVTREIRGQRVLLAGNELPWFGPAPEMSTSDGEEAFRILFSHSPDQLPWARRNGFHLMLAGHTHGGQIRVPFIGPLVTPSAYGVKYASGIFFEEPTLMQVSRGISGLDPIRLNCPPELTKLVLHCDDPDS